MSKAVFEHSPEYKNKASAILKHGFCERGNAIQPNWHEYIEILYCRSGRGIVFLDDKKYDFNSGNFIIVNANVIHNIIATDDINFDYVHIYREFCVLNKIDTSNIKFCEFAESDTALNQIIAQLESYCKYDGNLKNAKISMQTLKLLIYICENYMSEEVPLPIRDIKFERIKKIMVFLKENFERKLTLEEISEVVGINKYQLTREFKKLTGESLFEFINSLRCKEAKRMIKNGVSVSEAALSSGFYNLSYFSRTYKKYIGELPSDTVKSYRRY